MKINLDEIWDTVKPKQLVLTIDGHDWSVRRLLVADAKRLSEFSKQSPEDNARWMKSLFGESAPAFVMAHATELDADARRENDLRVSSLIDALMRYYLDQESFGKKTEAVHDLITAAIAAASSNVSSAA